MPCYAGSGASEPKRGQARACVGPGPDRRVVPAVQVRPLRQQGPRSDAGRCVHSGQPVHAGGRPPRRGGGGSGRAGGPRWVE